MQCKQMTAADLRLYGQHVRDKVTVGEITEGLAKVLIRCRAAAEAEGAQHGFLYQAKRRVIMRGFNRR